MLRNDDLDVISDHDGKVDIMCKMFKERLGQTNSPTMHFNLQYFYGEGMDTKTSANLEIPFSDKKLKMSLKSHQMRNILVFMVSTNCRYITGNGAKDPIKVFL
jgi:ssDNA-specific exonuclease RecJ